jgi:hypothetical protein
MVRLRRMAGDANRIGALGSVALIVAAMARFGGKYSRRRLVGYVAGIILLAIVVGTYLLTNREAARIIPHDAHVNLRLIVDSFDKTSIAFHAEAENIGTVTINRVTRSFESTDLSDREAYPAAVSRALAPNGKIILSGIPNNQLGASRFLSVTLLYDCAIRGKSEVLISEYRFTFPLRLRESETIDPSEWTESVEPRLIESVQPKKTEYAAVDLFRRLSQSYDSVQFFASERRGDGSANVIVVKIPDKHLAINFGDMTANFSVTWSSGKTRTIHKKIEKSRTGNHFFVLSWDRERSKAALYIN